MNFIELKEITKRLKEEHFEYAFGTYKEEKPININVIIEIEETDNQYADNVRYIAIKKINMYLIQKYKNIEQEEKIESKILKDIGWSSSEFENEDEGIYIVKYTFSICKLY